MSVPLAPALDIVGSHLSPSLVTTAARKRLSDLMLNVPARLGRWIYFECRLSEIDERVDLIVGYRAARRTLWFEFDLLAAWPRVSPPAWFVSTGVSGDRFPPLSAWMHAAEHVLQSRGWRSSTLSIMKRIVQELPHAAAVYYVGEMQSREPRTLRLCIAGLTDDDLPRYLERVGWPGERAALQTLLGRIAKVRAGHANPGVGLLHLDVGDGLLSPIGMEFVFERRKQLTGQMSERSFVDFLVDQGLCTAEKHAGVLQWPGYSIHPWPGECWPSVVIRRVNHVKIVYRPEGALLAKVYLSASRRFVPARSRTSRKESCHEAVS